MMGLYVCRLEASPEFEQWARKSRWRRQSQVLGGFLGLLLLCGGTFALVQRLPPHLRLPLADSSLLAPQLPLRFFPAAWHAAPTAADDVASARRDGERALGEARAQHGRELEGVRRELDAKVAQLSAAVQGLQAAQQRAEEGTKREARLLEELAAAQAAAQRAQRAQSMAAQAREDGLRRQLERAEQRLAAADAQEGGGGQQHAGLPPGGAAIAALALATAYALAYWHAQARAARAHAGELAALRRQAETQEVGACFHPSLLQLDAVDSGPPTHEELLMCRMWREALVGMSTMCLMYTQHHVVMITGCDDFSGRGPAVPDNLPWCHHRSCHTK